MTLIRPERQHVCATPFLGYYDAKTLWQCDECGRWWYALERPDGRYVYYAPGTVDWYPVTWWNFALRKRIRERL
jgi:hypothetical protein